MMVLPKYSMGIGDRFAHQGKAQLKAFVKAKIAGVEIAPVWNKSNREHQIIHTAPGDVRKESDAAVKALGWKNPYFVDADHISLKNVDGFIAASDFFTLDVADFTGKPADDNSIRAFIDKHGAYARKLDIPGTGETFEITKESLEKIARKYLLAIQEAGKIYRKVESVKGKDNFVTEVSMDETDMPQTPVELFFILAAISDEKIPAQTIAPKFTGRFNKGVDYVGDVSRFEREFNDDLCVLAHAIERYGLPDNLKLSVHSGSDKFSIYGPIHQAIKRHAAGLHVKTAGTTWLEEIIGLAASGGDGLALAREIYAEAITHLEELCGPYATVIDIDRAKLPPAAAVAQWTGAQFAAAVRHDPKCREFNPHIRQLLHVGYKLAAQKLGRYLTLVQRNADVIAEGVTANLFERHVKPIFLGE